MAIPLQTIEQIAAANDIVEVISSYFPLKRAGANFKALCPFHQEKTPSFHVSPQRQTFHCFGCGVGGSVFRFVMDYEHIDFPSAVRKLAGRVGIQVLEERGPRDAEDRQPEARRILLQLHGEAAGWFHQNLIKREFAEAARKYLKQRGITAEIAKRWRLGYAPDEWNAFGSWARGQGFSPRELLDRFRDRIMFPICNDVGEVIAFSGRVLKEKEGAAKYLNSPETPLFRKGSVLFGLDKTKRALIETNCAIVCEGQLDLISLFEARITNVVAPQGTAFTETQARMLKRLVDEVVLCFDSDVAGTQAAERSLDALLQNDLIVRVAEIPAGDDPDSLVRREGKEEFEKRIAAARDFFDYWIEKVSARLGVPVQDFQALIPKQSRSSGIGADESRPATGGTPPRHDVAMLCLVALRDEAARDFLREQNWREILAQVPDAEILVRILETELRPNDAASLNAFMATLSATDEGLVSSWLMQKVPPNAGAMVEKWWLGIRQGALRRQLDVAQNRIKLPQLSTGELVNLQKEVLDLLKELRELPKLSSATRIDGQPVDPRQ